MKIEGQKRFGSVPCCSTAMINLIMAMVHGEHWMMICCDEPHSLNTSRWISLTFRPIWTRLHDDGDDQRDPGITKTRFTPVGTQVSRTCLTHFCFGKFIFETRLFEGTSGCTSNKLRQIHFKRAKQS